MSNMSTTASMTESLSALRKIVGNEPKEHDLMRLLQRCNGDVNVAANAFFDGGLTEGGGNGADPFPAPQGGAPIPGMPVAEPVRQQQQPPPVVQVMCPQGIGAGDDLQVQTPQGLIRVKVPAGVTAGTQFLVRLPPTAQQGAAAPSAPVQGGGYPGGYPGGQMMQGGGYPGHAQMQGARPPMYMQQPQQQVHVVHASPYYGGYGYGYGDPFLAGTMGFMGGMLIADAMFW